MNCQSFANTVQRSTAGGASGIHQWCHSKMHFSYRQAWNLIRARSARHIFLLWKLWLACKTTTVIATDMCLTKWWWLSFVLHTTSVTHWRLIRAFISGHFVFVCSVAVWRCHMICYNTGVLSYPMNTHQKASLVPKSFPFLRALSTCETRMLPKIRKTGKPWQTMSRMP